MPAKTRWSEARPGELIMDYIRWFGKRLLYNLLDFFICNVKLRHLALDYFGYQFCEPFLVLILLPFGNLACKLDVKIILL